MIDAKIGEILDLLERRGYLDNAILVFTSDHVDNRGDHGHIQKHNMYEWAVRVPLIVRALGRSMPGRVVDEFVQWMDIAPTLLGYAGIPVPEAWESRSLAPAMEGSAAWSGREAAYAELLGDHIQGVVELMIMRRDRRWKTVFYLNDTHGELYDLESDPGETVNLWHSAAHRDVRDALVDTILRWHVAGTLHSRIRERRKPQQPMVIA